MSFLKKFGKTLRRIKPFKIIGKIGSALPVVGGAIGAIQEAKANADARKRAGEAPAFAVINGLSDVLRPPLSGPGDRAALSGMLGIALLIGAAILILFLFMRK